MDTIDVFDKATIEAMADAILLYPNTLPKEIEKDLSTLRQMLDKAVQGVTKAEPVPPAFGKMACPEPTTDENILSLRKDVAIFHATGLVELSPRRDGNYITVPRVVQNTAVQPGGNHD